VQKVQCPANIRIGTRKSRLAVAQATEVKNRLLGAFPELTQEQIILIKMDTTGDKIQDRNLSEIGGKGLFTREIEESLFSGAIDIAVHSMKDMPDALPDGLIIDCILEREDPRDALISFKSPSIEDLPHEAVIGTSSARRASQLLQYRPDLKIVPFRGNVQTRLKKLEGGEVDATLLAVAGLKRLDVEGVITQKIETDVMLPAVSQGAIGVECVADNKHIRDILAMISHPESVARIAAERGFLMELGGSCATPIAALANLDKSKKHVHMKGLVASLDGNKFYRVERSGLVEDADALGRDAGKEVLRNAPDLLVH